MFNGWLKRKPRSDNNLAEPDPAFRNDAIFVERLTKLVKLRDFIDRESVIIKDADAAKLSFGFYNSIVFGNNGTSASAGDWEFLEERSRLLMTYMKPDLLRRFELLFAPRALYWIPICLATVAAIALAIAVFPPSGSVASALRFVAKAGNEDITAHLTSWRLFAFLLWASSLGAIGAISFLYVNALSIQIDKNVDVTNKNFITMRVILGALFGVVLDLPLGYPGFVDFCDSLGRYVPSAARLPAEVLGTVANSTPHVDITGGALLLFPFLIGFSAPLMINILNRLVDLIQNLFGIKSESASTAAPAPLRQEQPAE